MLANLIAAEASFLHHHSLDVLGQLLGRASLFEKLYRLLMRRWLITFQCQYILTAVFDDCLGNFLRTTKSEHALGRTRAWIDRHGRAVEVEQPLEFGNCGDQVFLLTGCHLRQHQMIFCRPRAHRMKGGFARRLIETVSPRFAIDGDGSTPSSPSQSNVFKPADSPRIGLYRGCQRLVHGCRRRGCRWPAARIDRTRPHPRRLDPLAYLKLNLFRNDIL